MLPNELFSCQATTSATTVTTATTAIKAGTERAATTRN